MVLPAKVMPDIDAEKIHLILQSQSEGVSQLPDLLKDIKALVDCQSQTDPSFKSTKLYTRITAAEVRRQLIQQKGYTHEELPSEETIRRRLNELGYKLRKIEKTKRKDSN